MIYLWCIVQHLYVPIIRVESLQNTGWATKHRNPQKKMARMSWTALLCMEPQVWNAWNNCEIKAKEDTLSKIFSYNRGLLCKHSSDWLTKVLLIRGLNSSKLFTVLQGYLYFMCFSIDLHIEGINLPFFVSFLLLYAL